MHEISKKMAACVDECLSCYKTCLGAAMHHCLEVGGGHVEPPHFRLLMSCAEICRTAAAFMLIGSDHHKHVCAECAEICGECATDCERLGDMKECVEACWRCERSCRAMAA